MNIEQFAALHTTGWKIYTISNHYSFSSSHHKYVLLIFFNS